MSDMRKMKHAWQRQLERERRANLKELRRRWRPDRRRYCKPKAWQIETLRRLWAGAFSRAVAYASHYSLDLPKIVAQFDREKLRRTTDLQNAAPVVA